MAGSVSSLPHGAVHDALIRVKLSGAIGILHPTPASPRSHLTKGSRELCQGGECRRGALGGAVVNERVLVESHHWLVTGERS